MKVCRICLSKDCRLYSFSTIIGLSTLYHQLLGILKLEDDVDRRLPQWVCAECALRLMSYNKLRQKSLRSHQILCVLLNSKTCITEEDINKIDRKNNNLESNLSYSIIEQQIVKENVLDSYEIDYKEKIEEFPNNLDIETALVIKTEKEFDSLKDCDPGTTDNNVHFEINFVSDVTPISNYKDSKNSKLADTENSENDCISDSNSEFEKPLSTTIKTKTKIKKTHASDRKNKPTNNLDSEYDCLSDSYSESEKPLSSSSLKTKNKKKYASDIKKQVDKYMETLQDKINKKKSKLLKKDKEKVKKVAIKKQRGRPTDPFPIEDLFTVQTLSWDEQMAEMTNRQNNKTYVKAPYKCLECFRGFNSDAAFLRHQLRHSDKWGKWECELCKKRFPLQRYRHSHMKMHENVYRCKQCKFIANKRFLAVKHGLTHKGHKYDCPHCDKQFVFKTTYLSHLRIKHVSPFVCEYCGFSFLSAKGVDQHKNLKHGINRENLNKIVPTLGPTCATCNIKFVSDKALETHQSVSHPQTSDVPTRNDPVPGPHDSRITCELCGIETMDRAAYESHYLLTHPGATPTQWPIYTATARIRVRGVKSVACEQCGRDFMNEANLARHMMVHSGLKPFECNDCHKKFALRRACIQHINKAHMPKKLGQPKKKPQSSSKHLCSVCGKEMSHAGNLARHMATHSNLRPFACEVCGKHFKTIGEVDSHTSHVHLRKPWPRKSKGTQRYQ